MIFKLLLTGTLSLVITPGAYAQRVDLQAFGPAGGDPEPFALRLTGPGIRDDQPKPDNVSGLANDFATFGAERPLVQSDTKARRSGETAQRFTSRKPGILPSPINVPPPGAACEYRPYAPSPRLPVEAERRRAIWYPAMAQAACESGLPIHLYDALIIQESRYNPVAVSPKGATGLAQLMPSSARTLGVRNIWDPRENMRGGARYLRALLDEFGRFDLALVTRI